MTINESNKSELRSALLGAIHRPAVPRCRGGRGGYGGGWRRVCCAFGASGLRT